MATATMSTILSPNRPSKAVKKDDELKMIITFLNDRWSLNLPTPAEQPDSPSKRLKTTEQLIYNMISVLCYKDIGLSIMGVFDDQAEEQYVGWVKKPKAERGVVPESTRHKIRPITPNERVILLGILQKLLKKKIETIPATASFLARKQKLDNPQSPKIDDTAVPFELNKDSKRPREDYEAIESSKKPKTPPKEVLSAKSINAMPPPPRGRPQQQDLKAWRSANTSFESVTPSVFSQRGSQSFGEGLPNTQETIPDVEDLHVSSQEQANIPDYEIPTSSEFGVGSSSEAALALASDPNRLFLGSEVAPAHVNDELSRNVEDIDIDPSLGSLSNEDMLTNRLEDIFPPMPPALSSAPLAAIYEITRVSLHTGVTLTNVDILELDVFNADCNYDRLWTGLRNLPVLQGKAFPEKSEPAAWNAAQPGEKSMKGPHAVVFSGSLKFNEIKTDKTCPFFKLQLNPLKLDLAHRLGRRLGPDRFLELDLPHLLGRQVPKLLKDLGDHGRDMVISHLVEGTHRLLDRTWKPYHCRPKDRERKRNFLKDEEDATSATAYRVFFFAVDGSGFHSVRNPLENKKGDDDMLPYDPDKYPIIQIPELLNTIRPTRKNGHQPYLKLFSRTVLALSRNTATVVLKRSQIHDKKDIYVGDYVMTDGAGRMSFTLALQITRKLGLTSLPWGFQGRLGESKGFWTVDHTDRSGKDWIETYGSQQKWKRSTKKGGESDDISHRTFEVNRPSGELKSADLNLQLLPLLMDRARNKYGMKAAIAKLLETGLNGALEDLKIGMGDAPSMRDWIGQSNSTLKDKVKNGRITFRAGLPITIEERLNYMLDSGFQPKSIRFVRELTKKLFEMKCEELKERLNITVGKSAYVYMVPDFWNCLEPGEVYIDFSSFKDNVSGLTGVRLNNDDILVARSPAHFPSDIQKVKAVVKAELMGLQDVIVFSTKADLSTPGNPCLADKLSGGDYDGDQAWICWEPTIVENFENAPVPTQPDLVAEGFISEDKMSYSDLTKDQQDPVSHYLNKAFSFVMQESMLGICTSYKENVCYSDKSVHSHDSSAAIYLSTLLSSLVDQAKAGYSFTDADFKRFKEKRVKMIPVKPAYKKNELDKKSEHIIDCLMIVAEQTVKDATAAFHKYAPEEKSPYWDDDLVEPYAVAKKYAIKNDEWKRLLEQLDDDLEPLKHEYKLGCSRPDNVESLPNWIPLLTGLFEKFEAVQPHEDNILTQALCPKTHSRNSDTTEWARLKASAFFASCSPSYVPNVVWWLAGRQLGQIKANASRNGAPHYIDPFMMTHLKMNKTVLKLSKVATGRLLIDDAAEEAGDEDGV